MSTRRNNPDPVGLAIAREMQELLRPTKVILQGSRATGDHRQDSDVDLMAVCLDEKVVREADETRGIILTTPRPRWFAWIWIRTRRGEGAASVP